MSDLTDEELELACTVGTRLEIANHRAYVDRESLSLAGRLQRAAIEIKRHRSARAANAERVKAVVKEAIDASRRLPHGQAERAIATRAAEQLATAADSTPVTADISARITALTLAAGLPRDVWRELCGIDGAVRLLLRAQQLAPDLRSAILAILDSDMPAGDVRKALAELAGRG